MLLAQIADGTIVALAPAPTARGWDDGRWWDFADPAVLAQWMTAYGWVTVTDSGPQPPDTDTTRHVLAVALVAGVPVASWVMTPKAVEQIAAETEERTRVSLEDKVRSYASKGGTLDVDLGTTATAWTPGNPLTLRGWKAMTTANFKALSLAQTQEFLSRLGPLLTDVAVAGKLTGKLAVKAYDDSSKA